MNDELLDVIDLDDNVVGKATRAQIYAERLPHRIVHVLIFNNDGKILLTKMSKNRKIFGGHFGTAAGGHVKSDESYEDAAKRELFEEIGIDTKIEMLDMNWYIDTRQDKPLHKSIAVFKAIHNGPFSLSPDEVDDVQFYAKDEVDQLRSASHPFAPELEYILDSINVFAK
ncbi:MAG: NUDIX domain-containing protein [Patescibacteria group bacterium]|jgi:isopentenyldiphosphate isomerase